MTTKKNRPAPKRPPAQPAATQPAKSAAKPPAGSAPTPAPKSTAKPAAKPTAKPAAKPTAKPPSVPHPSAAAEKPPRPPRGKGDRVVDHARRRQRLRWVLMGVGLVAVLVLLVAVNVLFLQQEGVVGTPTATAPAAPSATSSAVSP